MLWTTLGASDPARDRVRRTTLARRAALPDLAGLSSPISTVNC